MTVLPNMMPRNNKPIVTTATIAIAFRPARPGELGTALGPGGASHPGLRSGMAAFRRTGEPGELTGWIAPPGAGPSRASSDPESGPQQNGSRAAATSPGVA